MTTLWLSISLPCRRYSRLPLDPMTATVLPGLITLRSTSICSASVCSAPYHFATVCSIPTVLGGLALHRPGGKVGEGEGLGEGERLGGGGERITYAPM